MKKFTLIRIVAEVIEVLAYLQLIAGIVLIIIVSLNSNVGLLPMGGSLIVFVLYWLMLMIPCLVFASLLKLGLAYYETNYLHLEVSREILRELKSKPEQSSAMSNWIKENPGKSLNDFYAEKK